MPINQGMSLADASVLFQQVVAWFQQGRFAEAEQIARNILEAVPGYADASHVLGLIAMQRGQFATALDLIGKAIESDPQQPFYYYNLGLALRAAECPDDAISAYQQAIKLNPNFTEAHINLGIALRDQGRLEEALVACRNVERLAPDRPQTYFNLGNALHSQGRLEDAQLTYARAIQIDPGFALAHNNRGSVLMELALNEEALVAFERAVQLAPDYAQAHGNRAYALVRLGRPDEALEACARAIQLDPLNAEVHNNRGLALSHLGLHEDALSSYDRAISLKSEYAEAHNNRAISLNILDRREQALHAIECAIGFKADNAEAHNNRANILMDIGRPEEALVASKRAIEIEPCRAEMHCGQGNALMAAGRFDEAQACYRRALELRPDYLDAHTNLLFALAARPTLSPAEMLEEQRGWDRIQGREGRLHCCPERVREGHPERRLRIGYVSPDLHRHPVSYFFEPLLAAHDRTRFEVFCYANHPSCYSDDVTQRLQSLSGHWRSVYGKSDEALARIIHNDGIDILVDLAGHTEGNRLRAFTYRPAPVQATYLGFFAATGLEAMDYWITDEVLHPLDTQEMAVEHIYRLPRCWVCYRPPVGVPDVSPSPSRDEKVMFGSFSNLTKLSPEVIETWSQLLRQLEGSRLLVMDKSLGEVGTRQRLLERFGSHGISADRLILRSGAPFERYLATYAEIDIVLDPFPRTGGTTTAEALWMGVPVITLAGQRYVERISTSKLTVVGLQDLVANNREEYLGKALTLARDPVRRAHLRDNLRDRMTSSPLCDTAGLAKALESAYESMWQRFLSEQVAKADGTSCTSMHIEQSQE